MLPLLILSDRITTLLVPLLMHWSLSEWSEEDRGKGGGKMEGVWLSKRWRISLHSGPQTGDRTHWGEWKQFVSLAFQLKSEPMCSQSWIIQSLSFLFALLLTASSDLWQKIFLYWAMGSCSYHSLTYSCSLTSQKHTCTWNIAEYKPPLIIPHVFLIRAKFVH